MAVKFSEFTEETVASNITGIVGYVASSNLNVRIAPGALSTSYDLTATDNAANNVPLVLTGSDSTADTVNFVGAGGIQLSSTGNVVTVTSDARVDSFTNANGTYVSATTANTAATGAVTVGTVDLSAIDGVDTSTRFLSKDNVWSIVDSGVTSFTNADGTYISAGTVNTAADGAVTIGTVDLSAIDGTSDLTTRFLSKDNTWDVVDRITGSGTANIVPLWTTTTNLGNSVIAQSGTNNVLVGGANDYSKISVTNGSSARTGITLSDGDTASLMLFAGNTADAVIGIDTQNLVFKTGANAGQDNGTERMRIGSTGQIKFNAYTSAAAFTGTAVASLAVDSSGNIITEAAASTRTKQAHTISNATTGALTLSTTPSPNTTSYVDLYISGVYQVASSYTLSGTTLTLAGGTFFPQGAAVETIALS